MLENIIKCGRVIGIVEEKKLVETKKSPLEKKKAEDWGQTYGIEYKHEYNPAYVVCPFCGCRQEIRNIDLWNGVNCSCGAIILKKGKEVYATKERKD